MARRNFALIIGLFGWIGATADSIIGSTVVDSLKEGFDSVYKCEMHSTVSFLAHPHQVAETSDVLLRKAKNTFDVPKFIMYIENPVIESDPKEPLTPTDLSALALPILVPVVPDPDAEFLIDEFIATKADTFKSLTWKNSVLRLLERNISAVVTEMKDKLVDRLHFERKANLSDTIFGRCHTNWTFDIEDEHLRFEVSAERETCDGNYSQRFRNFLKKYDENHVTGVTDTTVFNYIWYFDKATHRFGKSVFQIQGAFIGEDGMLPDQVSEKRDIPFAVKNQIEFLQYRAYEIMDEFDEKTITKLYKSTKF